MRNKIKQNLHVFILFVEACIYI